MDLFGQIGIDWRLVLAQTVNFAVLTWFLARFVYKPLLKRMDSSELETAERKFVELSKQKEELENTRQEILFKAKEEAAKRVGEAESLAEEISERVSVEAAEKKKKLKEQAKQQFELEHDAMENKLRSELSEKVADSLKAGWKERLGDKSLRTALRKHYWKQLLSQVKDLSLSDGALDNRPAKLSGADKITPKENKELQDALVDVFGGDPRLEVVVDEGLLVGFRLEVDGVSLDENLRRDINYAAEK